MRIGYISGTDPDSQGRALRKARVLSANTYTDSEQRSKGPKAQRRYLTAMLARLRKGDTLVVWRLDRLGHSLKQLIEIATILRERGVALKSLTENIDTTDMTRNQVFDVFAALAKLQGTRNEETTTPAVEAPKPRGRKGGRPPVTAQSPKVVEAIRLRSEGAQFPEILQRLKISQATLHRYLSLGREAS